MKPNYHWWPISFAWDSDPMSQTLWQWVKRAIESRKWTMDYPYRFRCLSTLELLNCLRMCNYSIALRLRGCTCETCHR